MVNKGKLGLGCGAPSPAAVSNHAQLFGCGRENLAAGCGHFHSVFDADAAEVFQIDAGLDGDGHARLEDGLVALAEAWGFMDFEAQSVASGMDEGAVRSEEQT